MLNLISWFSFLPQYLSRCRLKYKIQCISLSENAIVHIIYSYSQVPIWRAIGGSISRSRNRIMRYSESQKC
jgi:hypothetical protein